MTEENTKETHLSVTNVKGIGRGEGASRMATKKERKKERKRKERKGLISFNKNNRDHIIQNLHTATSSENSSPTQTSHAANLLVFCA